MQSRVVRLQHSGQEPKLSLQPEPLPEPTGEQVRVRFTSIGLNRADLLFQQNRYFEKALPNSRLGFEGAGIVDAAGPLASFKEGDRVATSPMGFEVHHQGCLAEHGLYASKQLIASPDTVNDTDTGAIWMAYLTAWGGLIDAGNLGRGETILITAASSSVGLAAIQLARSLDCHVIATTTSSEKIPTLKANGADSVLIQPRQSEAFEDFEGRLAKEAPDGVDLSFDAVAGPASRCLVKSACRGGRIVFHGLLDRRPMDIHAGVLMKRQLRLRGYTLDDTLTDTEKKTCAIRFVHKGLEEGHLQPVIAKRFTLDQYANAFDHLAANQHIGKIVINPD